MKDRFNLDLFLSGIEVNHNSFSNFKFQEITEKAFDVDSLFISTLAMDFPPETNFKFRKQLEAEWIELLPKLKNIKSLSVRHIVKQDYFEAICKMENLESLHFWTSNVIDISSISKLQKLKRLELDSFSQLVDINPILNLKNLELLSIENSYKIENYEIIGKMTQLKALKLSGNGLAPRNLILESLKPFANLKNLKHLDISSVSIKDETFEIILDLENLERFDTTGNIPKPKRDLIKSNHKNLKAGFFLDWDYENKKFYDGKEW